MDIHTILKRIVFIITLITTVHSNSKRHHDYYYKNYISDISSPIQSPPLPTVNPPDNWEVGLREAVYRALTRNRIADLPLKSALKVAPIVNRNENGVSKFGDIAMIARGQLYTVQSGFEFKQDLYPTDCDDCYDIKRCFGEKRCSVHKYTDSDSLVALWTIKRIRHRDQQFGQRYEFHYIITPKKDARTSLVGKDGKFDYTVPGHLFIVKTKPTVGQKYFNIGSETKDVQNRREYNYYENEPTHSHKGSYWVHRDLNIGEIYNPNNVPVTPFSTISKDEYVDTFKSHLVNNEGSVIVGLGPNGYKHIIHSLPELVPNSQLLPPLGHADIRPSHNKGDNNPLIHHFHHHYYISDIKSPHTTLANEFRSYTKPTITENTTPLKNYDVTETPEPDSKSINGHNTPENFVYKQNNIGQVFKNGVPVVTTFTSENAPQSRNPLFPTTLTNDFGVTEQPFLHTTRYHTTQVTDPVTFDPDVKIKFSEEPPPTKPTDFRASPYFVQYSQPDPSRPNTLSPTFSTEFITFDNNAQLIPTTVSQLHPTEPSHYHHMIPMTRFEVENQSTGDYNTDVSYEISKLPKTEHKLRNHIESKYPDSINAQLPPPDKGTDTTVPYVASTLVTQTTPTEIMRVEVDDIFRSIPTAGNKLTSLQPEKPNVTFAETLRNKYRKYTVGRIEAVKTTSMTTTTTTTPEYAKRTYSDRKESLKTTESGIVTKPAEQKPTVHEPSRRKYINSNFRPVLRITTSTTTESPKNKYTKALPKYRSKLFTNRFNRFKTTPKVQNTTISKPMYTPATIEYFDSQKINNNEFDTTTTDVLNSSENEKHTTLHESFTESTVPFVTVREDSFYTQETTTFASTEITQENVFTNTHMGDGYETVHVDNDFSELPVDNLPETYSEERSHREMDTVDTDPDENQNNTSTFETLTKQSYSTSISFQVGNRNSNEIPVKKTDINSENNERSSVNDQKRYPLKANIYEVKRNNSEFNVFQAQTPRYNKYDSEKNEQELFDDFALSLANHARGAAYANFRKLRNSNKKIVKPN